MDERRNLPSMSRLYRLAHCPGSNAAELPYRGFDPPSEAAESGNRIHAALEGALDPDSLTHDEYKTYEKCQNEFNSVLTSLFGEGPKELEIAIEERLWYGKKISGKPDIVVIHDGTLLIADYKTGRGEVEHAMENFQLRGLAVAASTHYPNIDEVYVCIIQPLAEGDSKCTMARYGPDALRVAEAQLLTILEDIEKPDAPRIPGYKQCQYCRAKADCPEALSTINDMAQITIPEDNTLAEQMPKLLDSCKLAEQVIKGIRAKAFDMMSENPDAIEGWKLKPGATRQIIKDLPGLFRKLKDEYGIGAETFAGNCNITKAKVTKLIRDAGDLKGGDLDAAVADILDGLVDTAQNKPSIAQVT